MAKRSINDGLDLMARAYPKWSSLRPQVELTLDASGNSPHNYIDPATNTRDAALYRLPWYVSGRCVSGWNWSATASNFGGVALDVEPERVERLRRSGTSTGYPQFAAVIPCAPPALADQGPDRQGRAVRFWPTPDQAYRVTGRFMVACPKLARLDDRHIFGASHDQTVLAFAVWAFKRHDAKDPSMRETYKQRVFGDGSPANVGALYESIRIDQESVPQGLGQMGDPGLGRVGRQYVNPGIDYNTTSMSSVL